MVDTLKWLGDCFYVCGNGTGRAERLWKSSLYYDWLDSWNVIRLLAIKFAQIKELNIFTDALAVLAWRSALAEQRIHKRNNSLKNVNAENYGFDVMIPNVNRMPMFPWALRIAFMAGSKKKKTKQLLSKLFSNL